MEGGKNSKIMWIQNEPTQIDNEYIYTEQQQENNDNVIWIYNR